MDRKKEPHDAAQKKWIIVKYFNALKYKKDQSLEEKITRPKILHKS